MKTLRRLLIPVFFLFFGACTSQADLDRNLVYAIGANNISEVKKALKTGANINLGVSNEVNDTVLTYAVRFCSDKTGKGGEYNKDIIKLLIDSGANINGKNNNRRTAVMIAHQYKCPEMVQFLKDLGARDDYELNQDFIKAVESGKIKEANGLIKKGADVNIDRYGIRPLIQFVMHHNDANMLRMLISHGADLKTRPDEPYDPPALYYAVSQGKIDMAKVIIESDAEIDANFIDRDGNTALVVAIRKKYFQIAKILVHRTEIKHKEDFLHWVIYHGYDELVTPLLKKGADPDLKIDKDNFTALGLAKDMVNNKKDFIKDRADNYKKIIEILEKAGAKE